MKYCRRLGTRGEDFAARVLEDRGFEILGRNFNCRVGEIDIIARKDHCIHFVEVKTRVGDGSGHPEEAVDLKKQQTIRRVADYYMLIKGIRNVNVSFDVVGVEMDIYEDCF